MFLRNAAAFAYITYFLAAAAFLRAARLVFLAVGFFAGALAAGAAALTGSAFTSSALTGSAGFSSSLCRLLHGLFLHNGLFLDLRLCLLCRSALDHRCNLYNGLLCLLGRGTLCTILHLGNSPQLVIACGLLPDLQDGTIAAPMPTVSTHLPPAQEERRRTVPSGVGWTVHI